MKIIALTGYKGAGKSTFAQELKEIYEKQNYEVIITSFVAPIRDLAFAVVGYTPSDYTKFKNEVVYTISESKVKFTGRQLIDNLCSKIFEIKPDFLRENLREFLAKNRGKDNLIVIIDDLRTLKDFNFLKDLYPDLQIIYVNHHNVELDTPPKEYYEELAYKFQLEGFKHKQEILI